jgi:hypothetical protein
MTSLDKGAARLIVDFNSVRDGKTLVGRFDFSGAPSLPEDGEHVQVYDAEGNSCDGEIIERIGDDHFRVRLNWDTWVDGDEETGAAVVLSSPIDLLDALSARVLAQARGEKTGTEEGDVDEFRVTLG